MLVEESVQQRNMDRFSWLLAHLRNTVASVSIHSTPEFLTFLHSGKFCYSYAMDKCASHSPEQGSYDSGAHLDSLCGMWDRIKALYTPALERNGFLVSEYRVRMNDDSGEPGAVGSKSITATEEAGEKCNTARHSTVMRNSCFDPCICRKLLLFWLGMHGDARLLTNWELFLHLPYKSCRCTHGFGWA